MDVVVLVPGIMGTELYVPKANGEEKIWPPTPIETQFGYKRCKELQRSDVRTGGIIRNVLCFDFYGPLYSLLADLGFEEGSASKRLIDFPYDWRIDLFDTAERLSAVLDEAVQAGASKISLVAHSMGGLICRLVLEQARYRDQPWYDRVDQLIAIATPHLGAPLALGRVLGRDSAMGISGEDFRELSNNEAFPSAYQLLPAPGEQACWDQNDIALHSLDIYDADDGARLGMNMRLIDRARALHEVLGGDNVPPAKRYFYFGAVGHRTATRVNVFAGGSEPVDHSHTELTLTVDAGDGTVPLYSALPTRGQRQMVANQHATAFKGEAFRRVFVRLLGGDEGDALESASGLTVELSVESPIIDADREIEVLILPIDPTQDEPGFVTIIQGELILTQIRQGELVVEKEQSRCAVRYAGPKVSSLRVYLPSVSEPGHYRLAFEGTPSTRVELTFSVCAPLAKAV